jgi:hypothetical protein
MSLDTSEKMEHTLGLTPGPDSVEINNRQKLRTFGSRFFVKQTLKIHFEVAACVDGHQAGVAD